MTRLFDRKVEAGGAAEEYRPKDSCSSSQIIRYSIAHTKHPNPGKAVKTFIGKKMMVGEHYPAAMFVGKTEGQFSRMNCFLAQDELYKSWLGRLHIGARIPKYSKMTAGADSYLLSREIPAGYRTLKDIKPDELMGILGLPGNLKALADMLVFAIVFKDNDFKLENTMVDSSGQLTRIDFEQVFFAKGRSNVFDGSRHLPLEFNFDYRDFDGLPFLRKFHPYQFFFNYRVFDSYAENVAVCDRISKEFPELKQEVYKAILKILLMPDFLNLKLYELYRTNDSETLIDLFVKIRDTRPECSFFLSQRELFKEMIKSAAFKSFLRDHGAIAMAEIKEEIKGFRLHNSNFRKSWDERVFGAFVDAEVDQRFAYLCPCILNRVPDASSSFRPLFGISIEDTSINLTLALRPVLNQVYKLDRLIVDQLQTFVTEQIERLNRTCFARGRKTKIDLLENLNQKLNTFKASPEKTEAQLSELYNEAAIIAFHRRSMSSHAFGLFKTPTTGWRAWSKFCHENNLASHADYEAIKTGAESAYDDLRYSRPPAAG